MLSKKDLHGALVVIAGTVICGAVSLACAAGRAEVFTGLVLRPVISPRPGGRRGWARASRL